MKMYDASDVNETHCDWNLSLGSAAAGLPAWSACRDLYPAASARSLCGSDVQSEESQKSARKAEYHVIMSINEDSVFDWLIRWSRSC